MCVEVRGRPRVEPPRVQILVVVANIQTGTLKAEVEKGSTGTSLERGSVGPKRRDSSRLKRVCDTNSIFIDRRVRPRPVERESG